MVSCIVLCIPDSCAENGIFMECMFHLPIGFHLWLDPDALLCVQTRAGAKGPDPKVP